MIWQCCSFATGGALAEALFCGESLAVLLGTNTLIAGSGQVSTGRGLGAHPSGCADGADLFLGPIGTVYGPMGEIKEARADFAMPFVI